MSARKGLLDWPAVSYAPRAWIDSLVARSLRTERRVSVRYAGDRAKTLGVVRSIKRRVRTLLFDNEAYDLVMLVQRTAKVAGVIAEVGAYRGGSSMMIARYKGTRALHVFDTFEGLPRVDDIDRTFVVNAGDLKSNFAAVKRRLEAFSNIHVHKGVFPRDTAHHVAEQTFSLVHLDVDTYQSTKDALEFFYPRMTRAGVIASHDYATAVGVRRAVDEFFSTRPEIVLEGSGAHCFIVKL